ncbi:MAG: hypothetical protein MR272_09520, partial [Pseudoflavonifractor sp.]|nr:hypothetical protein [Pseudoflavonifractor sp.]MDY3020156.1 hypothetical protein [Oscillospiraceae bacterium]
SRKSSGFAESPPDMTSRMLPSWPLCILPPSLFCCFSTISAFFQTSPKLIRYYYFYIHFLWYKKSSQEINSFPFVWLLKARLGRKDAPSFLPGASHAGA